MSETTSTMTEAWSQRYRDANVALQQAAAAPALVTPKRLEELRAEVAKAKRHHRFWLEQDLAG